VTAPPVVYEPMPAVFLAQLEAVDPAADFR
jgi:hypothetical protein